MMLRLVPAWKLPTVTTTGSKMSNWRVTMTSSASSISAATMTGSLARCGAEPWPPTPCTVTMSPSLEAISVPGRVVKTLRGSLLDTTCIP